MTLDKSNNANAVELSKDIWWSNESTWYSKAKLLQAVNESMQTQ